jgi:hypothetical protein
VYKLILIPLRLDGLQISQQYLFEYNMLSAQAVWFVLKAASPLMQESFAEQFNEMQDWEQAMALTSLQRLVSILDRKL